MTPPGSPRLMKSLATPRNAPNSKSARSNTPGNSPRPDRPAHISNSTTASPLNPPTLSHEHRLLWFQPALRLLEWCGDLLPRDHPRPACVGPSYHVLRARRLRP